MSRISFFLRTGFKFSQNQELIIANGFYGFLFQYTDWDRIKDGYLNQRAIADVVGDYFFICPSTYFAELFAARGMNVYYYFFTQVSDYFCYHVFWFSSVDISHRQRLCTSSRDSGRVDKPSLYHDTSNRRDN